VDAQLIELARTAGVALVTVLATDAWESARDGLVGLWRRASPERAEAVQVELDSSREDLVSARTRGDAETEQELGEEWSSRLRRLLREHPEVADELRAFVAETEEAHGPGTPHQVNLRATASGSGRVYQAGRDQHINER
jgi:hypothetical protein